MDQSAGSVITNQWYAHTGWGMWSQVANGGASPGSPVTALARYSNLIDLFMIGIDNRICTIRWTDRDGWSNWSVVAGGVGRPGGQVAAISRIAEHIDLLTTGPDGIVYAIGGGGTSLAVRSGGRGDVSETHVLWKTNKGSNAASPIYHEGKLYWSSESGGVIHCQDAATGKTIEQRLSPPIRRMWASPILADGKLYFVSQFEGAYVVAATPKLEIVAHNVLADDTSRSNASRRLVSRCRGLPGSGPSFSGHCYLPPSGCSRWRCGAPSRSSPSGGLS
jgi:hypothetical protein